MDEEKTEEESKPEAPADNTSDGIPAKLEKEISPIEEAKDINKKKEALLEREEKLMERKEKLEAERMVGGRSTGVQPLPQHEETAVEYKNRIEKEG